MATWSCASNSNCPPPATTASPSAPRAGNELIPYQVHDSVYYLVSAKRGFLRPTGQWNAQEIEVRGNQFKFTLNGTRILDADLDRLDYTGLTKPGGVDRRTGHIGFAGHSDPVAFRNFRVKKL